LGDGSSPFYKNESPKFSANCEVSAYLETSAGILKALLAKHLNRHVERARRLHHDSETGCEGTRKTSQSALNCLGLFVERT
jgi:hypothetical protein